MCSTTAQPHTRKTVHVVITGGACSGKTTTLGLVADALRERGLIVACSAETPTEFVTQTGISLGKLDDEKRVAVQNVLVARMRDNRHYITRLAAQVPVDVALYDCGELNGIPYIGEPAVARMLASCDETIDDMLHAYSLVLIMEAGPYELDSNPARYEEPAQAQDRALQVGQLWSRHRRTARIEWDEASAAGRVPKMVETIFAAIEDNN